MYLTQERFVEIAKDSGCRCHTCREWRKNNPLAELPCTLQDVPYVSNIDSKILAVVENTPHKFDMQFWGICPNNECGTSMCRGGWAIHLAGPAGHALLAKLDDRAGHAAALIYANSRPDMTFPNFYCGNTQAIEDIKECAKREKEQETSNK